MTQEELIKEIKQLPLERQREILDAISRNVRETTGPSEEPTTILDRLQGLTRPDVAEQGQALQAVENGRGTISQRLYGILQFDGGPPTDEEGKNMIADYLVKKYY